MGGKVLAVVVSYESGRYMDACIGSLLRQDYPELEILVVDNASTDDSAARAEALGVKVIPNRLNVGFAAANNQGADYASEHGAKYLLLINPDTESDPTLVSELVRSMDTAPDIGLAQAKVLLMKDRARINTAGIAHHYLYFGYCDRFGEPEGSEKEDRDVAVGSGSCLMLRMSVLKELGYLFDPDFFMYHEDSDLCIRAWLLGYRTVVSARAVVWHDYRFGTSRLKFYHMEKNRLYLLLRNYRALTLWLLLPALLFTEAQVVLYSIFKGWSSSKFRAYAWLFENIGKVMEGRREIRAMRVRRDYDMLRLFAPTLDFVDIKNPAVSYITNPLLWAWHVFVKVVLGVVEPYPGRGGCSRCR